MKKPILLGILFLSSMLLVSCGESSKENSSTSSTSTSTSRSKSRAKTCVKCGERLQTDGNFWWCVNEMVHG